MLYPFARLCNTFEYKIKDQNLVLAAVNLGSCRKVVFRTLSKTTKKVLETNVFSNVVSSTFNEDWPEIP